MSIQSRQRAREKGRAWTQQEKDAYREKKQAKRFKLQKRIKAAPRQSTVEAPIDSPLEFAE